MLRWLVFSAAAAVARAQSDCVGAWSPCDVVECSRTFTVTTAATDDSGTATATAGGTGGDDAPGFPLGGAVQGLYPNGNWYNATIAEVLNDGASYVLDWADGDIQHRTQPPQNVRRRAGSPCAAADGATVACAPSECVRHVGAPMRMPRTTTRLLM